MKRVLLGLSVVLLTLSMGSCQGNGSSQPSNESNSLNHQTQQDMNSYLALFEIPATDINRAVKFYQAILGIEIEVMAMPGMEMGILPYENQAVQGVIMKAEGSEPGASGVTIYLNAGNDLQVALDKVEANGGSILMPKTAHADESGFFAIFLDSEGNKMGLNSPN